MFALNINPLDDFVRNLLHGDLKLLQIESNMQKQRDSIRSNLSLTGSMVSGVVLWYMKIASLVK